MATNIEMAAELNKLLQEQLKIFEEQNKSLKEQTKLVEAVVAAHSKVDENKTTDAVNKLNVSMQQTKKTTEEFSGSFVQGMVNMAKRTHYVNASVRKFAFQFDKLNKVPLKILAVSEALKGVHSGIQLANSGFGFLIDKVGSVMTSFGQLAISIAMIPFKLLGFLMEEASEAGGSGLRQAIEDVRKQFGDLSKNEGKAVIKSFRNMRGVFNELSNTGLTVHRVFGNYAERLKFLNETAQQMGRSFNKFKNELMMHEEEIATYVRGLGLAAEQIKAITDFSNAGGKSLTETGREITTMAYGMGDAFAVNGKLISRDIADMMGDFKNFGSLGVKQMTQISIYTHKLGLEVKDLLGVIDKFDNFEDAAESAAHLSQAFGMQLDALDMMFDQDPASRFEKLRKSFLATGKSVESLSRQEKNLLAQQTGLDVKALELGFSQSNLGLSYEEIQKQASLTEKKQLSQAEATKKLADSIERMVKEGQKMKGGFFDIFTQGFMSGIKLTDVWIAKTFAIKRAMRQIFRAGREVGRAFVQIFPGVKDVLTGIKEIFNYQLWESLRKKIVKVFKGFFNDLAGGNPKSLSNLFKRIKSTFTDHFDASTPAGKKLIDGFKKIFKVIADITKQFVKIAMEGITKAARSLTEFIKSYLENPDAFWGNAKQTSGPIAQYFIELFEPIWNTMVEQWPALKDALLELLNLAFTKTIDLVKEHWKTGLMGLGLYLAPGIAIGIARVLGVSLLSTIAKAMVGKAIPKVGEMASKFFGSFSTALDKEATSAVNTVGSLKEAVEKTGELQKGSGKINLKQIGMMGVKFVAIGAMLAGGAYLFVQGLIKVSKILDENGLNTIEKIVPPLLVLTAAIGGVVALGHAAKAMQTVPWGAMIKTTVVGAAGVGALSVLSIAIAGFFVVVNKILSSVSLGESIKTIGIMVGMTTSLALLGALVIGLGAILINPVLLAIAGVGLVGLGALELVSLSIAGTALAIIKVINSAKLGTDFEPKLKAFTTVVTTIADFANIFTKIMQTAQPSFFSLKRWFGDNGEEARKMLAPMESIISKVSEGIKSIFSTVVGSIKGISGADANSVSSFVELFKSTVQLALSFQSTSITNILGKIKDGTANPEQIKKLVDKLGQHVWAVSGSLKELIPILKDTFSAISGLKIDKGGFKKIEVFSGFINSFVELSKLLQTDQFKVTTPGQSILDFLINFQTKIIEISHYITNIISKDIMEKAKKDIDQLVVDVKSLFDSLMPLAKDIFKDVAGIDVGKQGMKKVEAFAGFMNAFTLLAGTLQANNFNATIPGDAMVTFMSSFRDSAVTIADYAADIKDNYIKQASDSVRELVKVVNDISNNFTKLSKASNLAALNVQLKQTADNLSLQGTNEIKMKMDEINFNVYVDVKLSVDELEKSLTDAKRSKIATIK